MGDIAEFSLKLSPPLAVFYPGQKLSGEIKLETTSSIDVQRIVVKVTGKGYSRWQESRGIGKNQRTTVDRVGKEEILKLSKTLYDEDELDSSEIRTFSAGTYQYQFTFELPDELPSSFEGKYGYIRYVIKARISRPGRDDLVKCPISINDLIDTNDTRYATGLAGNVNEETGCLCLKGWFDFKAMIKRSCYCPGEAILLNVDVKNHTGSHMKSLNVKLMRKVIYRAKKNHKEVIEEVAELEGPKALKKVDVTWKDQPFGIPATQPTILNSKVITVRYMLKVSVEVPIGDEPVITLNITIGTIPYLSTYGEEVCFGTPEDPQGQPLTNLVTDLSQPSSLPKLFGYPDMHPTLLSAAVGDSKVNIGKDKDFNTYGDLDYIPVYTFAKQFEGSNEWFDDTSTRNSQIIPVLEAPDSVSETDE